MTIFQQDLTALRSSNNTENKFRLSAQMANKICAEQWNRWKLRKVQQKVQTIEVNIKIFLYRQNSGIKIIISSINIKMYTGSTHLYNLSITIC